MCFPKAEKKGLTLLIETKFGLDSKKKDSWTQTTVQRLPEERRGD